MHRAFAVFLLCLCSAPVGAATPTAAERLHAFLRDVKTLRAEFTQTVLDANLATVQESSGTLVIQRPGRFRWEYVSPFAQTIIADGERIWIYDAELAQVTVKKLDETLASTPAMLLGGASALGERFEVTDLGISGALSWVELVPRVKETDFVKVRLGFGTRELETMELTDTLGQTTRIQFRSLERNIKVDSMLFRFTPPPGADVIGDVSERDGEGGE